jgi:ABC-type branched-subunit amino acid transport system permease subunit
MLYVIFIVVIGGLGTIAGTIAGTLAFFLLREPLAARRLWAYVARRFGLCFFPSSAAFAAKVRSPHGICAS